MLASKILKTSKTQGKTSTIHEKLLVKGGFVQKLSAGIYQFLPLGFLVYKKIYKIIEEELEKIGFLPFLGPMVQPGDLWKKTGRFKSFGSELLKFKNRAGEDYVLAPTHEENTALIAKITLRSFRDLPLALNQIQPKFRDEPRSRGGLIRLKEFTMQDGYSFHRDLKDLDLFYQIVKSAYLKIFERAGLEAKVVQSSSGAMGGNKAEEFMVKSEAGEDRIATCLKCDYAANLEVARFKDRIIKEKEKNTEEIKTPNASTIEALAKFLKLDAHRLAKIVFFVNEKDELIVASVLGDREVNERKLAQASNSAELIPAPEEKIKKMGFEPGFAKPQGGGKNVKVIFDHEVWESNNLVTGANKKDVHLLNFNPKRESGLKSLIADIAEVKDGDPCSQCSGKLKVEKAIEVGNIFQLGDKYSKDFKISITNEKGKKISPFEGCYGIGLERLIATVVETHNDEKGIIWPRELAPYEYYLIYLGEEAKKEAEKVYEKLEKSGKSVLFDDRENSPGEKFADADLIGCSKRIIISEKTLSKNQVEIKDRSSGKLELVDFRSLEDYFSL